VDGFAVHAFSRRQHERDISAVAYHRVGSARVSAALPHTGSVDGSAVHAFSRRQHGRDISAVAYHRVGSARVSAALPLSVELPTLQTAVNITGTLTL
jgi:hypothetical protein